jgi:hypothetical protein
MRSPKQQFTTRIHYYNGSERTRLCSKKNMIFVSCEQKHFWFEGKLTPFLNNWSVHLSINGYIKKNHVSSVSLTIFTIMQSKSIWQKIRKFYYLPWSPWAQLNNTRLKLSLCAPCQKVIWQCRHPSKSGTIDKYWSFTKWSKLYILNWSSL